MEIQQKILYLMLSICTSIGLMAQEIPTNKVLTTEELPGILKTEIREQLEGRGSLTDVMLAEYFRQKFSERFFYDYKTFYDRLVRYNEIYNNQAGHKSRALDHMGKYADSTQWMLPFEYLNGEEVRAYALRHLARQHKMVDIALYYFIDDKNHNYIKYFENQMLSLNAALHLGQYEKIEDGNGVYEVFRSGYRVLNWLWIHNMFLNEEEYSDTDQLQTIATLLQHGAHLYEQNNRFRPGNHQTRGMSALVMLSILLRDFEGADKWFDRAVLRLSEHLDKEINSDGFQFERSIHYHMSDINNYFYVYQLTKINNIKVGKEWEEKLRALFTTLTKIAYPDGSAPVLQDDTDIPWAEKNDISGVMTLGYLLFEDPEFGYFASDHVDEGIYWFLQKYQLDMLTNIQRKAPTYGSLAFEDTHYYIMREGWNTNDKMMIISAGLDKEKPDHQHGDILGIQAMANEQVILPNYQVRYSLPDFELFKNSTVKNVALVDDELQGKQWTSNKGGSGFGKFKNLPNPQVIAWKSNEKFDLFIGSHDGFEKIGVEYTRQLIYIKDAFWIVKDNFQSEETHKYKQVWQGHFTHESGPNMIRATFADASACDILQLNQIDAISSSGARGKNWTEMSRNGEKNFSFLTIIFPYMGFNNRIDETNKLTRIDDWIVDNSEWGIIGSGHTVISKKTENYFFGVRELKFKNFTIQVSELADMFVQLKGTKLTIRLLDDSKRFVTVHQGRIKKANSTGKELSPGEQLILEVLDK